MKKNWLLYVFIAPAFLYLILFHYVPIYGVQIAFRNYTFAKGITGSPWVGLKWFERFFSVPRFWNIVGNTLKISLYDIIVGFPLPIILAVILNQVKNARWKKFAQTITYMPHFITVVVLVSMMQLFFSPGNGIVNTVIQALGGEGGIYFMGREKYFIHMFVWSGIWKNMGWGSIIYLAALSGVDPSLHESAMIDGANQLKRVWYIDLPSIAPTITIMLVLRCGSILGVGYEKAFLMQNDLNIVSSEIISTYVYKQGIISQQYGYSAAIGLFNNVINFTVLLLANKVTQKLKGSTLW